MERDNAMEVRGLRTSRQETQYLWFGGDSKEGHIGLLGEWLDRVK